MHEDTIRIDGHLSPVERPGILESMIAGSAEDAMKRGDSLALIRPRNTRFTIQRKAAGEIEAEREAYRRAAGQLSMLDRELAELEPTPFHFRFSFEDNAGRHSYRNGDWESHAMFFRERGRTNEAHALEWMRSLFNEEYPRRGMAFAIGNQAKRPRVWQLLGVIRLDEAQQGEMPV